MGRPNGIAPPGFEILHQDHLRRRSIACKRRLSADYQANQSHTMPAFRADLSVWDFFFVSRVRSPLPSAREWRNGCALPQRLTRSAAAWSAIPRRHVGAGLLCPHRRIGLIRRANRTTNRNAVMRIWLLLLKSGTKSQPVRNKCLPTCDDILPVSGRFRRFALGSNLATANSGRSTNRRSKTAWRRPSRTTALRA